MDVPIKTVHLFPKLDQKLLELLKSLHPDDWSRPTLAKQWTVKDIASHLLDGNFRTLSFVRDKHVVNTPKELHSYQDLVDYLNKLNADWVIATKRLSYNLIIDLLQKTGEAYCACLKTLKPFDASMFSVAWAGQSESKNWFHIAREYTEKWHHQQQIREAVEKPGIMDREFYFPMMDTFMQALPYTYRKVAAPEGTHIKVI
ncbi:MAG TPA: maleylpyruvate isomerase N-terminal domain-containing protein, partial [Cyclobacteriaceae bacterium]|nr:maleylpyruvate isomerase N-terminal domain-containing protein [Cyclobacteriaceae bacterium]